MARKQTKVKKKTQEGKELAPVLPGEGKVSAPLVDATVAELNRIYVTKGLETARAVGECVLDNFFDGDTAKFRERGNGHVSFRELGKREDLHVGWQFIYNAVAVVEQYKGLPTDLAEALPLSHHKLLLTVKDESAKVELAKAAVTQNLGKRELEVRVKEARGPDDSASKAGRPPLPGFAKAVTALQKVVKTAEEDEVNEACFAHFSKEQATVVLEEMDRHIAALAAVAERVRAHVAA